MNILGGLKTVFKMQYVITYSNDRQLGAGAFGKVYRGEYNGSPAAVKVVLKNNVNEREEEALKKLKHDNVVKLFHAEDREDIRCYALELCEGSLDQVYRVESDSKKYVGRLPECRLTALYQLATGLAYIHRQQLVHRDIKPGNVLISAKDGQPVVFKWADFGLSRSVVNPPGTYAMSGFKGTDIWMAPEKLELAEHEFGIENDRPKGTIKSDVFSAGCTFCYYLMDGVHPFGGRIAIPSNILKREPVNLRGLPSGHLAAEPFIEEMLKHDPKDRATSDKVVQLIDESRKKRELFQLCAKMYPNDADVDRMIQLIGGDEGVDVNGADHRGLIPILVLCRSCQNGQALHRVLMAFIERGATVDRYDEEGSDVLQLLLRHHPQTGLLQLVQSLVETSSIDVNRRNKDGWTALHFLFVFNHDGRDLMEIAKFLIQVGKADVNARNSDGWNALHLACRYCKADHLSDAVSLLIASGADVAAIGYNGKTAIGLLAEYSPERADVAQLFDHAADSYLRLFSSLSSSSSDETSDEDYFDIGQKISKLGTIVGYPKDYISSQRKPDTKAPFKEEKGIRSIQSGPIISSDDGAEFFAVQQIILRLPIYLDGDLIGGLIWKLYKAVRIGKENRIKLVLDNLESYRNRHRYFQDFDLKTLQKMAQRRGHEKVAHLLDQYNHVRELTELCESRQLTAEEKQRFGDLVNNAITDINLSFGRKNNNILHLVVKNNESDDLHYLVQLLISKGINIINERYNNNALHALCEWNQNTEQIMQVIAIIEKHGVDVNQVDRWEQNLLHCLARNWSKTISLLQVAECLYGNGINVCATDRDGKSALHLLCEYCGNSQLVDMAKWLVSKGVDPRAKTNKGENALHLLCQNIREMPEIADLAEWLVRDIRIDVNETTNEGKTALAYLNENKRLAEEMRTKMVLLF